jgi:hypothetical protein
LRVLEYYSGILILTTNRVGIFDEAVRSRLSLQLYYPELDGNQTLDIWKMNMRRTLRRKNGLLTADQANILEFAERQFMWGKYNGMCWNGRQIRSAFQTATALAEFEAEEAESERRKEQQQQQQQQQSPLAHTAAVASTTSTAMAATTTQVTAVKERLDVDPITATSAVLATRRTTMTTTVMAAASSAAAAARPVAHLTAAHFRTIAAASHQFEDYIAKALGETRAERAQHWRERADDYVWRPQGAAHSGEQQLQQQHWFSAGRPGPNAYGTPSSWQMPQHQPPQPPPPQAPFHMPQQQQQQQQQQQPAPALPLFSSRGQYALPSSSSDYGPPMPLLSSSDQQQHQHQHQQPPPPPQPQLLQTQRSSKQFAPETPSPAARGPYGGTSNADLAESDAAYHHHQQQQHRQPGADAQWAPSEQGRQQHMNNSNSAAYHAPASAPPAREQSNGVYRNYAKTYY